MAFNEFEQDTSKFFLHAVNVLLQVINERPIENPEDLDNIEEARFASNVLLETKREVLADGWDINIDKDYVLPLDTAGYINIPYNVLDLSSTDGDLVMRDWKLYSKKNQTQRFDDAQKVDVVWDLEFNSLPQPLRNYITVKAARKFQARQVMDKSVYSYTQQDEELARVTARRSDGRTTRSNTYTSSYGVQYMVDGGL